MIVTLKEISEYPAIVGDQTWIRKMRTLFHRLDKNGHGSIGIGDLLNVASTMLSAFPKCDNCFGDQLVQSIIHLWYGIICTTGEEHTRTHISLNEAAFVKAMLACINTSFKKEFMDTIVTPSFELADMDHDGCIQMHEFSSIIDSWQGNKKEAELLFKIFENPEKKGKMSKKIFEKIFGEYFFDEGIKGKTAKLWGALINYKRPEDYPECECGPTWEGKIRTMFRRLDINQAGKLRCHDFIQIGRSLAQRNHLDRNRSDSVMRAMLDIWVHYFSVDKLAFENGKSGNHFTELSEKEFIHNLRSMINGEFRHAIDQFGWTFFKAVEVEGNGFLSMAEYRNLQESWHVGKDEAEGMFRVLDTDKDGKISSDEYLTAWVDYFLGEDPKSPYKTFFGPVIFKPAQGK